MNGFGQIEAFAFLQMVISIDNYVDCGMHKKELVLRDNSSATRPGGGGHGTELVPTIDLEKFERRGGKQARPALSLSRLRGLLAGHVEGRERQTWSCSCSVYHQQYQEKERGEAAAAAHSSSLWPPYSFWLLCRGSVSHLPSKQTVDRRPREWAVYPAHDWELFQAGFDEMSRVLKIFVYRDAFLESAPFANVFLPHPDPFNPKLGNYFSEHMFKINLLRSSFLTSRPEDAHLFFLPFSINAMRNDPRVRSEPSIANFVANYTNRISHEARFWNASAGSDHFYVCCHSVGRFAASKHSQLHTNAMQVSCSSSYFQRLYISHKDVGLPQVWPRPPEPHQNPPHARSNLVFFSGRAQNSRVRQELISAWKNDTSMSINAGKISYEDGFRSSRYCLHVKGYEVNTARISDAIHYGCVPVIVSDHYDLPFARILDWKRFSVIIKHEDIGKLKEILVSISQEMYESMYFNLRQVREHFQWHKTPRGYDAFHMTVYELWARRAIHLPPI